MFFMDNQLFISSCMFLNLNFQIYVKMYLPCHYRLQGQIKWPCSWWIFEKTSLQMNCPNITLTASNRENWRTIGRVLLRARFHSVPSTVQTGIGALHFQSSNFSPCPCLLLGQLEKRLRRKSLCSGFYTLTSPRREM